MSYTANDIMTVTAARRLRDEAVCFVGIGLPSTAANLARLTHAPNINLIYESGTIGTRPSVLPLSIGDGELATTAETVVSTPEIFRYWLQGGRVDVGFLGAAQIDRYANITTTVIGSYASPKTRLPGAGGAPDIAALAKEVFIIIRQSRRAFVEKLDFITSAGHLEGGDSRKRAGLPGKGPTDLDSSRRRSRADRCSDRLARALCRASRNDSNTSRRDPAGPARFDRADRKGARRNNERGIANDEGDA
jgi:glutaconate CoA-transferase subunit B